MVIKPVRKGAATTQKCWGIFIVSDRRINGNAIYRLIEKLQQPVVFSIGSMAYFYTVPIGRVNVPGYWGRFWIYPKMFVKIRDIGLAEF